jgi:hypothetical protein
LGRARRIPHSSAGRLGHYPAGAGLESPPLNRQQLRRDGSGDETQNASVVGKTYPAQGEVWTFMA